MRRETTSPLRSSAEVNQPEIRASDEHIKDRLAAPSADKTAASLSDAVRVIVEGRAAGRSWAERRAALETISSTCTTQPFTDWLRHCAMGGADADALATALRLHAEELRPSVVTSACRAVQAIAHIASRALETPQLTDDGAVEMLRWLGVFVDGVRPGVLTAASSHVTSASSSATDALQCLDALQSLLRRRDGEPALALLSPAGIAVAMADNCRVASESQSRRRRSSSASSGHGFSGGRRPPPPEAAGARDATADESIALGNDMDVSVLLYTQSVRKHAVAHARYAQRQGDAAAALPARNERPRQTSGVEQTAGVGHRADHDTRSVAADGADASKIQLTRREHEQQQRQLNELNEIIQQYEATIEKMLKTAPGHEGSQSRARLLTLEGENNKLKAELLTTTEAFEAMHKHYTDAKQRLTHALEQEHRLRTNAQAAQARMEQVEHHLREFKQHAEQKLAQAFQQVSQFKTELAGKAAALQAAEKELEVKRREGTEKDAAIAEAVDMYRKCEREHEQLRSRSAALESEVQSLRERAQQAEAELELLRARTAVPDHVAATLTRHTVEHERQQQMQDALNKALAQLTSAQREHERLSAENQSLKARTYDMLQELQRSRAAFQTKEPGTSPERRNATAAAPELNKLQQENRELHAFCEELLDKIEAMEQASNP
ncbi:hypothetical protein CDCA_CDCA11G3139 [Cyanidium caldarium]|uniref:Transforming acidic coiled-coil-containing protein C-terminal domain-containing protein n=1 Tax=Cyanidium caldarium TaxID=2771 RepID=A0AAV9IXV0_CYACA|nr:hypothetical protein CDCA_CDCA11G3139 [Cyanidium caldarium]